MKKYKEKLKDVPDGFAETYSVELYMKETTNYFRK